MRAQPPPPKHLLFKPATEKGFTGPPDSWFDDKSFEAHLIKDMAFDPDQDYYFGSYSHFNIHEEMIKDRVRTESY